MRNENGEMTFFVTLTAPGDDVHIKRRTGETCECTPPGGVVPAVFNAQLPRNWSALVVYLRRSLGQMECGKASEVQMRRYARTGNGLLHVHALIRSRTDLTHHVEEIRRKAMRWGFGHEVNIKPVRGGEEWYVSKYGTKSCDDRQRIDTLNRETGEVVHGAPRMRTLTTSRGYGKTMKDVKVEQREFMLRLLATQEAERSERERERQRMPADGRAPRTPRPCPATRGPRTPPWCRHAWRKAGPEDPSGRPGSAPAEPARAPVGELDAALDVEAAVGDLAAEVGIDARDVAVVDPVDVGVGDRHREP
jgi:hypothetical protein